jgi:vacuolar-type H+-ATPase subunit I/STV1
MSLNKLSVDDQEKIKSKFADMREKLIEVKNIMEDNVDSNFSERDDIIKMVDEINSSSTVERKPYSSIGAKGESMVKSIRDKRTAQETVLDAAKKINDIEKMVKANPFIQNDSNIMENVSDISNFYTDINPKQMSRNEIELVDSNFDKVTQIHKQVDDEIKYYKSLEADTKAIKKTIDETYDKFDRDYVEDYIKKNSTYTLTDQDLDDFMNHANGLLGFHANLQEAKDYEDIKNKSFDELYAYDRGKPAYDILMKKLQGLKDVHQNFYQDLIAQIGAQEEKEAVIHIPKKA